ncbi:MAG: hypothetical protein HY088_01300 [Ignavibacteriales bacterium]|nr:hypothetical protein [Ignavibacteriales bacterium]
MKTLAGQDSARKNHLSVRGFFVFYAFMIVVVSGCEREIPLALSSEPEISGYRIEGTLTDRLGNPYRDIPVQLFYDYGSVDSNDPPSKEFQVNDPVKIILVGVYDRKEHLKRILFNGRAERGPFVIVWDQKESNGVPAPSGVYTVRYIVDEQTKKSYPVTVSGNVTARTDSLGKFLIPDDNLPIDFYPVPLYNSDSSVYYGNHRIIPYVVLQFALAENNSRSIYLHIEKNHITRIDIKF